MKPFVLLATRPEENTAESEYRAFLKLGGLKESELIRLRLERHPMPKIDLDEVSGFFVGGSPFSASTPASEKSADQKRAEADLMKLLDRLVPLDFPFFGACYGVGTLGLHQGAIIDETYGEEISPPLISLTEEGKRDPLLAGVPPTFHAYVGHKEACTRLPEHAVLLATAEKCPMQMFRIGKNMYGTQFHPELDWPGLVERVEVYRHHGYYPPEEQQRILDACGAVDVSAANKMIRAFVELHAR